MSGLHRRAVVDLARLRANALSLAASAGPGGFWADVRADAYGHGRSSVEAVLRELGIGDFAPRAGLRPLGLALYGLERDPAATPKPVLTLTAEVVAVKRVPAGRRVSYGYTYEAAHDTTLALVGLGYADGLVRAASNRAEVVVAGGRSVVAGRVAMDQFVADAADRAVAVGDEVVLFGDGARGEATALEWAEITGIRAPALTAGLGSRIERLYLDGGVR